jgi:uncharacterized surface protein with fasciclin (FAS1) repeats
MSVLYTILSILYNNLFFTLTKFAYYKDSIMKNVNGIMKNLLNSFKRKIFGKAVVCFFFLLLIAPACNDEQLGERFATFEEELITDYLAANQGKYSEFYALLDASGLADLLNAYGTYTCFVPTNEAVRKYYEEKGVSFEQMTLEEIKEITYNHIISRKIINSIDFPVGIINSPTMDNRFLYLSYGSEENSMNIYVNDNSRIIALDNKLHNGVVHTIDRVLAPSKVQLPDVIAADERFSLFTEALMLTGMSDSLRLMENKDYVSEPVLSVSFKSYFRTPAFLKYGYTAFMESDSTYADNGIHNLNDLKAYAATVYDKMYPEDKNVTDVTDRRNSLNRFVSYHLLDRMIAENEFIAEYMVLKLIPGAIIYEYMETMCPNTLMEVQTGILFNKRKDGSSIRILSPNHNAENGIYHEINKILVYDEGMENDVLNKRLRMDFPSMLPELVTNKIRGDFDGGRDRYIIPPGYLKYLTYTENTEFIYFGSQSWGNLCGDELFFTGKYDITFRLAPVPPGRYEIRIASGVMPGRGVGQIYFDGEPCGIPRDMSIQADAPQIGWIDDKRTPDDGVENDKMMHNRGYMKGPNTIYWTSASQTIRSSPQNLRMIITTKTFDKAEPHVLRIKSVEENTTREFQMDFIEFVPTTYMEKEGRD